MKSLSRGYVWWPSINQEIEHSVRECAVCQQHQHDLPATPVHP